MEDELMTIRTTVKTITDGDTFKGTGDVVYRLEGVNTPERREPKYEEAKQYLRSLIGGKTVSIDVKARDVYGRSVVQVWHNQIIINEKVRNRFG